jgi:hypothetical protein
MATHQLAQGLASLGRHGDSMLMHVSPSEVAGLKAVGAMTGHKIHTNPHTGMPEAFDFGDFFTSLIPTGVGFLLGGPAGAAMGFEKGSMMAPVIGGMAAGAAVAGAKGEDPLMGGLMGGLGGYGGGNLAGSVGKMGANALNAPLNTEMAKRAAEQTAGGYAPTLGGTGNVGMASTFQNQLGGAGAAANVLPSQIAPQSYEALKEGVSQFASDPFGKGYDAFKAAGGSGMQLAAPLGMAALSGASEDMYPEADLSLEEKRKAEENKYRDPRTGLLNLAQASPGLRLMATGGTVNTNSSTISSGGIQDLYGTNDQTTGTQNLSKDGYGIGRLNTLAAEGSRAKAADTFYAMGGPIAFAKGGHQGYLNGDGDGMSDSIPATIEGKQPARLADGEFVIPADVVSHIGNGSSKAGSKQLYAMLDRIRKARTGHTKQGKEIKPRKYMPA